MKKHLSKIIIILALISLVGASLYGHTPKGADVESYLPEALPGASSYELLVFESAANNYLYAGKDNTGGILGYVTVTEGIGYGGAMTVVTGWTDDGTIKSMTLPLHRDDAPWIEKLYTQNFFEQYLDIKYDQPLVLGDDIDAASGATVSSNGISMAVHQARQLVSEHLGDPYPVPQEKIHFGLGEILLIIGLLSVVLARTVPALKRFKWSRYITLAFGLGVLGMWLSKSLSLTNFTTWFISSPPHFATQIFLYIMVFGVIGLIVIFGKNMYCYWLCPFSAVQEVTYKLGRGGIKPQPGCYKKLRRTRYVILWAALLLALAMANPSVASFEPWGTLFSMAGTPIRWLLLFFALAFSAFIYQFWCQYICPVGAVLDIVLKVRREIKKLWTRIKPRRSTAQI